MFFQGEIYNKAELGFGELPDAEALIALYRKQGVNGFAGVRGAFACAIEHGNKTILIRDQCGSVPFYYYSRVERVDRVEKILCSTSVRELLGQGVPRKLSKEGLFSYLAYGCLYAPYTMIEGVRIVPPGCVVTIEGDKVSCERYWKPSFDLKSWEQDELQAAINSEFARSLAEQVETPILDSPSATPAAFLSGGIDSSSIVSMWRKQFDGEIRTYCVTHEDPLTDERKWSRMVAERNHTKHTELMLEDRLIREWFDEAVASYDQPSLDGLNFWFATKLLKMQTNEKLVFSGEGGDELFMGYGQFIKPRLAYRYSPVMKHLPRFVGAAIDAVAPKEKYRKLAMLAGFKGEPYYTSRRVLTDWQIDKTLNPELKVGSTRFTRPVQFNYTDDLPNDLLNRISWLEMQTVTADMWMRDGFQTSASNGLALRMPICDVRLAELLYTVPGKMKCDEKISKPLLVRAAGDGLPMECVTRKKQGFALPFDRYFFGEVRERIDEFLAGGNVRLFKPEVIRRMGRQYREGKLYWSRVWELFMVENWCRANKIAV